MNLKTLKSVNNGHDAMWRTHNECLRDIDNVVRIVGPFAPLSEVAKYMLRVRWEAVGSDNRTFTKDGKKLVIPGAVEHLPFDNGHELLVVWAKEPFAQSPAFLHKFAQTYTGLGKPAVVVATQNSPANQPIEYKNRDIYPQRTTGDTLIVVGKYIASAGTRGDIAHSADGRRVTGTVASAYEDEVKSINTILATNNNKVELVWVKDKAALVDEAASGQGLPGGLVGAFHGNPKDDTLAVGYQQVPADTVTTILGSGPGTLALYCTFDRLTQKWTKEDSMLGFYHIENRLNVLKVLHP
jgi:hypothetical protein